MLEVENVAKLLATEVAKVIAMYHLRLLSYDICTLTRDSFSHQKTQSLTSWNVDVKAKLKSN